MSSLLDGLSHGSTPPPTLFKYLVADRVVDMLEAQRVRFTPLADTNDTFEIRKTFRRFAGPKFQSFIEDQYKALLIDKSIDTRIENRLRELGFGGQLSTDLVKRQFEQVNGISLKAALGLLMASIVPTFMQEMNNSEMLANFMDELGSRILCFSLSERYDSSVMWAHYAGNNSGFVVCFDTGHPWFMNASEPTKSRLQKVEYFDGQLEEPFDNPQAAFISKTADWEYEREWRLNCGIEAIECTLGDPESPIHLRSFPADAVSGVIVGCRAKQQTVERISSVLSSRYPHAFLQKAKPDAAAHSYSLVEL